MKTFVYINHKDGIADDVYPELHTAAKKLDSEASVTAIVAGYGDGLDAVCNEVASLFDEVWKLDHEDLSYVNAEVLRGLLTNVLPEDSIFLTPHDHFGMDLAPGLSVKVDSVYVPDVVDFKGVADGNINVVREEYGGVVSTLVLCDASKGAVMTVRAGSFKIEEVIEVNGPVVDKTGEAVGGGILYSGRRFIEIVEAEKGDVDITKSDILVSVGRGIEDEDNLDIIHELAEAMGGDVSCSRPIVDAKWLDKSRQVGTSGQTVKPKVYMAMGISGTFQHMGGIKGGPFIVAVNKNANAPIFQLADVGIVEDILDFIPELIEKINESK